MTDSIKKWEVKRRLDAIERHLYWDGSVGRKDIIDHFGVSLQQVSADFKIYFGLIPDDQVRFNGSTKRYEPTDKFIPSLITPNLDDYARWSGAINKPIEAVPLPLRTTSSHVVHVLTRAIYQSRCVKITYCSMSNPDGSVRTISPHSLVFNGNRHHVRAYCYKRSDFRDFVIGRIQAVDGLEGPSDHGKIHDDAWNTLVIVRIGPHPQLTSGQRKLIEKDFGMANGEAQIKMKQALLFYFLDQFKLDKDSISRPAVAQQIVLLNPEISDLCL